MEINKDKKNDDILEKLVHINRITKVVKGGRRFGFSALVVVGNQAGKIGIAQYIKKKIFNSPILSYQNLKFEKIISDIKKEDNLEKILNYIKYF